jgi:hypothetical protein
MEKLQHDLAEMTADLNSTNLQLSIVSQHINQYDGISKHIHPGDVLLPGAAASEITRDTDTEDGEPGDNNASDSDDDDDDDDDGDGDGDDDDGIDGEAVDWDPDDPFLYSGEGEIPIGNTLIRVHDWLGEEYTRRIVCPWTSFPICHTAFSLYFSAFPFSLAKVPNISIMTLEQAQQRRSINPSHWLSDTSAVLARNRSCKDQLLL